jgi:repressor LexA
VYTFAVVVAAIFTQCPFCEVPPMADFSLLTQRQREIYEFIRDKIENRGYGPTVREIGDSFHIESPNGVMCHLKALEKKGLIVRQERSARAIQLVDRRPTGSGLPMLGLVAAGSPVEALEQQDRLEFTDLFGGPNRYALKVRGQSMIEDHIADGDYVVIHKQETARNGERVVAMIDGEVTLKRYYEDGEQLRLEPANGTMRPIKVPRDRAKILGILVGVVRKC